MPEPTHHSYMLRLWRERVEATWRVTLIVVAPPIVLAMGDEIDGATTTY